MGRKPKVDPNVIDNEIVAFREEIVIDDGEKIAGVNAEVWQKIATKVSIGLENPVTPASIRIRVARNGGNIQQKLGMIKDPITKDKIPMFEENSEIDDFTDDEFEDAEKLTFNITFSVEEWRSIQPHEKIYYEKRGPRTYNILTPYEWSNIIQDHFYLHTRLPCCLTFKKASVTLSGIVFLSLSGRCSNCGSIFSGKIDSVPAVDTRVIMDCVYHGYFREKHFKKRRLMGAAKEHALKSLINERTDPSIYTRNQANLLIREGEPIPAQIPNLNALKNLKFRAISSSRAHSDPITAINFMKRDGESCIHDIGLNKFFVHFWSSLQLKIYKESVKKSSVTTISFDATGGCCRRIKRSDTEHSGHIFLYEGVMKLDNRSFTVLSMLSEQHDNISISVWLKRWLKESGKPPKVVISDQSLALMSGLAQSFTQYSSLDGYLDACFSLIIKEENVDLPLCFIRNDVNHFIHLVTQWPPVKNSIYPSTKQIITRTMGLLVQCTSIREVEKILEALFDIILSKYDGNIVNTDDWTPCYKAKRYLQSLVTTNTIELVETVESAQELNDTSSDTCIDNEYYLDCTNTSFKDWAQSIADNSRTKVDLIQGMTDNAQYLLTLEPIVIRTLKLLPCWSAIMVEKFGFGEQTASSSRIECNFNHIKNRVFKNDHLPLRVDSFLEQLIDYYRGDHLLIQGDNCDEFIRKSSVTEIVIDDRNGDSTGGDENSGISDTNDGDDDNDKLISDNQSNIQPFYTSFSDKSSLENQENNTDNCEQIIRNESSSLDSLPKRFSTTSSTKKSLSLCYPCSNGDFPSGAHKCSKCQKCVHLLGCSIAIPGTEEGYGEPRICIECDNKLKSINAENDATEKWNRKGKRSSRSYLSKQPGFHLLDLNKKGKTGSVVLLKNGNSLLGRPILVPGVGKFVLSNTCSVDSILSILATSAADSEPFRKYLCNNKPSNLTAKLTLLMIEEKKMIQIYQNRLSLVQQYLGSKEETLVGGLKSIDVIGTAACVIDKMMDGMPSLVKKSTCSNSYCPVPEMELPSTKLSLSIYNEEIDFQKEVDHYIEQNTIEKCPYCGNERIIAVKTYSHVFIELIKIPFSLEASMSFKDNNINMPIDVIKQNFANPVNLKLESLPQTVVIGSTTLHLRGIIAFQGGERRGLRIATGHYSTFALRGNTKWELYDGTKPQVICIAKNRVCDVEILFYSI